MSRNSVACASPSRKVRTLPGCSSTYQRPSAAWNAPVICVNVSAPIARTRRTWGRLTSTVGAAVAVGACVGTGVDPCGVGVSPGVGAADVEADPDDADAAGDGAVVVLTADGDEQAIAATKAAARPKRRSRITTHLSNVADQSRL